MEKLRQRVPAGLQQGTRKRLLGGAGARLLGALILIVVAFTTQASGALGPSIGAQTEDEGFLRPQSVVVASDRYVCTLMSSQKADVGITGKDGAHSMSANGVVYWMFGDTVILNGTFVPNSVSLSNDDDAADCVTLIPRADAGRPVPLLPRDEDTELTVWPTTMEATSANQAHIFYTSVVPDSEWGWRPAGVGLASVELTTLDVKRALGGRMLWGEETAFPVSSVRTYADEAYVYVFLVFSSEAWVTENVMARVPKAEIESPASYEYWDPKAASWVAGLWDESAQAWKPELQQIGSLWRQAGLHNGVEVAYNAFLGRWLAVYTGDRLTKLTSRTAPSLTGPWEDAQTVLVNCPAFHQPTPPGFLCYSGYQHEFYAKDGGRTIYVSYSNGASYQVYLHEVRLAAPVREWIDASGHAQYAPDTVESPADAEASGVAFYASDIPVPGFSPIHRWVHSTSGEVRYGALSAGAAYADAGIDFYAPADIASAEATNATYAPVYRWTKGSATRYSPLNLSSLGYARSEVGFYGACPDRDGDELIDCVESFVGTSLSSPDSDGDGTPDGDEDSDGDGCSNRRELSAAPRNGGHRDPASFWDFLDTPDANGARDQRITVADIMRMVSRFGSRGNAAGDPLAGPIPAAPAYHTSFDRGPRTGSYLWSRGPADGAIGMPELLVLLSQLGHDCTG